MDEPRRQLQPNKQVGTLASTWLSSAIGSSPDISAAIVCATSDRFHNKEIVHEAGLKAWAEGFIDSSFATVWQLADHLKAGNAICTGALGGARRLAENVRVVYVFGSDHDGLSVEQVLKHPDVLRFAAIVYPTASHTDEAPRCRALWVLDTPLPPSRARGLLKRLLAYLNLDTDDQCIDPSRVWLGSTNPNYYTRNRRLSVEWLETLPEVVEPAAADATPYNGTRPTADDLLERYYNSGDGRNTALFNTARFARDRGWSQNDLLGVLLQPYTDEAPRTRTKIHPHETPATRTAEAKRTISSAYRRSAQPPTDAPIALPNAALEALSRRKQHNVARVYEALLSAGYFAGQTFTAKDALRDCPGMAQKTVRAALKEQISSTIDVSTGEKTEETFNFPFCHTPASAQSKGIDQCLVRVANGENNKRGKGRPTGSAEIYTFPSIEHLCAMLGVKADKPGDSVDPSVYGSTRAYKQAKHSALVQRYPDKKVSMKLLSERLGVSSRTIRRYNNAEGIEATPNYVKMLITYSNLDTLPFAPDIDDTDAPKTYGGLFIEDATDIDAALDMGKKYPPRKGLAARMLKAKRRIYLVKQEANSYCYRPKSKRAAQIITIRPLSFTLPKAAGENVSRYNPFSREKTS